MQRRDFFKKAGLGGILACLGTKSTKAVHKEGCSYCGKVPEEPELNKAGFLETVDGWESTTYLSVAFPFSDGNLRWSGFAFEITLPDGATRKICHKCYIKLLDKLLL